MAVMASMWQSSRGSSHPVIVVFDGYCNLCSATVQFLLKHDRSGRLRFASFQQPAGQELLRHHHVDSAPETVYVLDADRCLGESEAILYLLRFLGPWWQPVRIARFIPANVRNSIYRWIARNRYPWFGRRTSCRLPEPHEVDRFL